MGAPAAEKEEIIIRQVNPSITIFSKPFKRQGLVPFGGRSTAAKLSNGSYLIFASTPVTPLTQAAITGPVEYIIAPDSLHWLYLSEWAKAYPSAKVFGVEDVVAKQDWPSLGVNFAGVFSKANPTGDWPSEETEIKVEYFKGFLNQDVAVLHVASRTLIEADLLFNLPATEQFSHSSSSANPWWMFGGLLKPSTWVHRVFLNKFAVDKQAMCESAAVVASWDFDTVIPCHGDVIESGGKAAWTGTYSNFLKADSSSKKAQ